MHHKKTKINYKMPLVAIIVLVTLLVIGWGMGSRIKSMFFGGSVNADLVIVNDMPETASIAFTRDGKIASRVMHKGEKVSGGHGLVRVFVAKKSGAYEVMYPYPRPMGKPTEVSVSEIIKTVHNQHLGKELVTANGMIDDIKVMYEEVRDLDASY